MRWLASAVRMNLPAMLPAVVLVAWALAVSIRTDFWHDEVYTLNHFVLVTLRRTVTDYTYPNNHVLFSVIANLYLWAAGVDDMHALMGRPWVIRVLPLLFALTAVAAVYRLGLRFYGRAIGFAAAVVLATTIPFVHYSVQVRGYTLSMTLLALLVFCLLRFDERPGRRDAILVPLLGALLLYALPVNLYPLLSMALFLAALAAGEWLHDRRTGSPRPGRTVATHPASAAAAQPQLASLALAAAGPWPGIPAHPAASACSAGRTPAAASRARSGVDLSRPAARHLAMAGLVLASGLGAILLYLPMLDQMWGHEHLGGVGRFNGDILRMMPVILGYFTSVRWLLIGVIVAGAFGWALRLRSPGDRAAAWRLPFLAFVLLMPFVLSFVKGDRAVDRLFLNQAVIFALLVAVAAHHARALVARPRAWGAVLAALLAIYCYGCFGVAFWRIDARLQRAAAGDGDRHDIYYGWYASHFHPSRLTAQLRDLPRDPSVPVAVHACADGVAMAACLVRDQILFRWMPDLAGLEFDAEGRAYIITGAPARTRAELARLRPDVECRAIETDPGCHSLLLCRRRAAVPVER